MMIAINQRKEAMIWGLGEEQIEQTDVSESLASYEHLVSKEVKRLYPNAKIEFTFDDGQPSAVEVIDLDDSKEADEIAEQVNAITERVFNEGKFWS